MYEIGTVVRPTRGRGQGKLYCVLGHEGETLCIADGREHSVHAPKRKNPRHLVPVLDVPPVPEAYRLGNKKLAPYLRKVERTITERLLTHNAEE